MGLLDFARSDWNKIVSSRRDFGVEITIVNPATSETATFTGTHTKHWFRVDFESGALVNSRNAHIAIPERELIAEYYPVRNAAGEVAIKCHIIYVKDSTGITKSYKIDQQFPDETVGVIVCLLVDYKPTPPHS